MHVEHTCCNMAIAGTGGSRQCCSRWLISMLGNHCQSNPDDDHLHYSVPTPLNCTHTHSSKVSNAILIRLSRPACTLPSRVSSTAQAATVLSAADAELILSTLDADITARQPEAAHTRSCCKANNNLHDGSQGPWKRWQVDQHTDPETSPTAHPMSTCFTTRASARFSLLPPLATSSRPSATSTNSNGVPGWGHGNAAGAGRAAADTPSSSLQFV
jgi:hypothetical protein